MIFDDTINWFQAYNYYSQPVMKADFLNLKTITGKFRGKAPTIIQSNTGFWVMTYLTHTNVIFYHIDFNGQIKEYNYNFSSEPLPMAAFNDKILVSDDQGTYLLKVDNDRLVNVATYSILVFEADTDENGEFYGILNGDIIHLQPPNYQIIINNELDTEGLIITDKYFILKVVDVFVAGVKIYDRKTYKLYKEIYFKFEYAIENISNECMLIEGARYRDQIEIYNYSFPNPILELHRKPFTTGYLILQYCQVVIIDDWELVFYSPPKNGQIIEYFRYPYNLPNHTLSRNNFKVNKYERAVLFILTADKSYSIRLLMY